MILRSLGISPVPRFSSGVIWIRSGYLDSEPNQSAGPRRGHMPDVPKSQSLNKATVAVLKGGPDFQVWFKRLQELTRLPAALVLDAALVAYSKSIGFDEPPPR